MIAHQPIHTLPEALQAAGFAGQIETDSALRAAMATDNSVYQITPDLVVAPRDAADVVRVLQVLQDPAFADVALTPRGGGTGTNGQSLNRGLILDLRRHMTRVLEINAKDGWADVEPGVVLDALNDALRPHGWFFAPETSTSTRCTIGGMVSTDASGKGSRIYGKTSDNVLGLEVARPEGLLSSLGPAPDWAVPVLAQAERAAREGKAAFVANTPRLNRRFTGYDLDRACSEGGGFDWWRLFLGAEGTLGPITRIRVKLRRIEPEKRLIVAGFATFRDALAAATPLLADDPTAIEVMDEWVQRIAQEAGILAGLPPALRPEGPVAYVFVEFNGHDAAGIDARVATCLDRLRALPGQVALYQARDLAEIRRLWAIRSAGVGLLAKVDGPSRPVAFVEDCVVPPENLPAFVDDFLDVLRDNGLGFGIYGHVDVGCLHIRPALNIDSATDRARLVAVSDAVFALTRKHGGIFWGEHGKGMRGAYLPEWIGPAAYAALQGVKAAFDPAERFNPGKLVTLRRDRMGIATTPFRPFNAPDGDALDKAFRCNGNAQCLSYQAATPMCPSFKATGDLRQSPKGRADALRAWKSGGAVAEADLLAVLDSCLGCKACASTCPVQVDIPSMRTAFYQSHYSRHTRPLPDRLTLLAERHSGVALRVAGLARPLWPLLRPMAERLLGAVDLPERLARPVPRHDRIALADLGKPLPAGTVLLWQDWFTALFDGQVALDAVAGLRALGYRPLVVGMHPAGKAAQSLGAQGAFDAMAARLVAALTRAAASQVPMIGLDPAFVMHLRQDYPKAGYAPPALMLPQEFLSAELAAGRRFPSVVQGDGPQPRILSHCTETTALPEAGAQWAQVFAAIGLKAVPEATGCCGMAGLFGHQARHQPVSRRLFDMSWRPHVEAAAPVVATGFSCRCQAERLSGRALRHPLALVAEALGNAPAA
ncbi:FAD/FMN-containing dehydrogenase [Gemmobacter megaterium]|uniref:FAD/FMN-containing dehydrogenase n=1 Tax=Gemmobacter megaterium TaxID=1086013 RepID=A0A1N7N8Z2_9RHOB|nr:FAD-binding and (Fe-S)-binding domain-containing protein [Gemmobacter megaterium]GGE13660.1 FAD-linked oxidase [Gemmobacter megaterium]SIS94815.1 FAD/FMN-containing dehydrogenase [Gemmobacter megaterium]